MVGALGIAYTAQALGRCVHPVVLVELHNVTVGDVSRPASCAVSVQQVGVPHRIALERRCWCCDDGLGGTRHRALQPQVRSHSAGDRARTTLGCGAGDRLASVLVPILYQIAWPGGGRRF
mgnify:CR=1 FL=1